MTEKSILEEGAPPVDTNQPHHIFTASATGFTAVMDTRIPANGPAIHVRMSGEEGVDPIANAGGKHIREDLADDPANLALITMMRQPAYWDPQHPDHLMVKSKVMSAFRDGIEE